MAPTVAGQLFVILLRVFLALVLLVALGGLLIGWFVLALHLAAALG